MKKKKQPGVYRRRPEIKALMKRTGVSVQDLAAVVNKSPSSIYGALNGWQALYDNDAEIWTKTIMALGKTTVH